MTEDFEGCSQKGRRKLKEVEWFLSAEADRKAVSLPASPGLAVILGVSAVHHSSTVDQRLVEEALHVQLCSILKRAGGEKIQELRIKPNVCSDMSIIGERPYLNLTNVLKVYFTLNWGCIAHKKSLENLFLISGLDPPQ